MRKWLCKLLILLALIFALSMPVFAAATITNLSGEKLNLEIKMGKEVSRALMPVGLSIKVGADRKMMIIVKSEDNKNILCQGTFESGDKLVVKKKGEKYIIEKEKKK